MRACRQMWFWGAPNQLRAIWKVLVAENALVKRLFDFEIAFVVGGCPLPWRACPAPGQVVAGSARGDLLGSADEPVGVPPPLLLHAAGIQLQGTK